MTPKATTTRETATPSRFWQKISLIAEIAGICRGMPPTRRTFVAVLKHLKTLLPFDGASLYLSKDDGARFSEVATLDERVAPVSFLTIGNGPGLTGWTASSKKPVLLSDRKGDAEFDGEEVLRTILSLPLLVDGEVLGVLNLGCYRPGAYREEDVKLMTVVAEQFAISIERQIHQTEMEEAHKELEEAHRRLGEMQSELIASEQLKAVLRLAGIINHQINNPLAVIVGNIQCLFAEEREMNQRMISRLRKVEASALKIGEVNRQLLDIDSVVSRDYVESRLRDTYPVGSGTGR